MEILRTVINILFILDCIALTVIVLMQEGKSQGLGTIAGMADTYWGKNKVRRAGSYCRCSRYLLGKEQRPFYGRSTCEIHKVSCNRIYRNFHSSESEFLRNLQNCHRQVLLNA